MKETAREKFPSCPLTLVFGASGYIGTHLVPRLLAEGRSLRAVARRINLIEPAGRGKPQFRLWAGELKPPMDADKRR